MELATGVWPLHISGPGELTLGHQGFKVAWQTLPQGLPKDKPALSFHGEPSSDCAMSPDTVLKFLVKSKGNRVNKTHTLL